MSRHIIVPIAVFLALAATSAAQDEGAVTLRTFDLSMLSAPRVHRFGPELGAVPSGNVWEPLEIEEMEPEVFLDVEQVAERVLEMVEPASWDDVEGASIDVHGSTLFVRNRVHVLRKVAEFLKEVEAAASRRVLFRVKVLGLPRERYAGIVSAPPAEAEKGGTLLESGSVETYPGIRTSLKVTNRVRYISDYDVEIAQTASIADPVMGAAEEGLAVDLVPHPTLDGERVLVEALIRRGTFDRPIRKLDLDNTEKLGTLDLPTFRHVAAFSTALVRSGGTMAIPFVSEGRLTLVLVQAEILGRGGSKRILDAGVLSRSPLRYTVGFSPECEKEYLPLLVPRFTLEESEAPLGGIEELVELLVSNEDPWYWEEEGRVAATGNSLLLIQAKDEVLGRAKRFLEAREAEVLRPIRLDLRMYQVVGDIRAGARGSLDEPTWTLALAGSVTTLPGRPAALRAGNTMNVVADYDVEVAQEAQIADPIVGQSFEGLAANMTPQLSGDGARLRLDLALLIAHRTLSEKPVRTGAKHVGPVDGLSEKRTVFNETVEFPANGVYVIDAGPDVTTPGKRVAIVIKSTSE